MNTVVKSDAPRALVIDRDAIRMMTVDERLAWLVAFDNLTTELFVIAADVWKSLEDEGVDLRSYRRGTLRVVYQIAQKLVHPAAAAAFRLCAAGRKVFLLPVAEQSRLAAEPRVAVVEKAGGQWTHRLIAVEDLNPVQVSQVFDGSKREVRTEAQQIAYLSTTAPPWKSGKDLKDGEVSIDSARTVLRVGRYAIPLQRVAALMKKAGVHID